MSLDEMSLPSGPVGFGTQSLADEIRQALEEEGLEDLGGRGGGGGGEEEEEEEQQQQQQQQQQQLLLSILR